MSWTEVASCNLNKSLYFVFFSSEFSMSAAYPGHRDSSHCTDPPLSLLLHYPLVNKIKRYLSAWGRKSFPTWQRQSTHFWFNGFMSKHTPAQHLSPMATKALKPISLAWTTSVKAPAFNCHLIYNAPDPYCSSCKWRSELCTEMWCFVDIILSQLRNCLPAYLGEIRTFQLNNLTIQKSSGGGSVWYM